MLLGHLQTVTRDLARRIAFAEHAGGRLGQRLGATKAGREEVSESAGEWLIHILACLRPMPRIERQMLPVQLCPASR
jgi:hypothetical protein